MSRIERIIAYILTIAACTFGVVNWRRANLFKADNEALRARLLHSEAEATQTEATAAASLKELEIVKQRAAEVIKLRAEVTQLRGSSQTVDRLTVENQRLKTEVQQLRNTNNVNTGTAAAVQNPSGLQYPRDSWRFAGYTSPESALVSAIWAMKEGNPQTYLESLAPAEQQRLAATWQNMTPEQIAAKHKSDVANITGLRVLEQQTGTAPGEMVMNVYLEGPGRVEKIRMNQVGQDWKFGGIIQQPPQPGAATQ